MKKLSNFLKGSVVFLAVVFAFFTSMKQAKAVTFEIDYYWFYDEAATSYTQIDNTISYMKDLTGCTGINAICLYGYRADDFNTYGVPSSGLKTNHGAPVTIKEV